MTTIPSIVISLDRDRVWQLDVPAFERVCDGFDEVGLPEFAENPIASLQALTKDMKGQFTINRRISKILRVWLWAGLTGEDAELKLANLSKMVSVGTLPAMAVLIIPVITESLTGSPQQAAVV